MNAFFFLRQSWSRVTRLFAVSATNAQDAGSEATRPPIDGRPSSALSSGEGLADLSDSRSTFVGFVLVGPILTAATTIATRVASRRVLYGTPVDAIHHFAVALVTDAMVGIIAGVSMRLGWSASRYLYRRSAWHRRLGAIALGVSACLLLHRFLVATSRYSTDLLPWFALALAGAMGALLGEHGLRYLRNRSSRPTVGVAMLLIGSAVNVFCLVRYVRFYGNVHLLLLFIASACTGLGSVTLLSVSRPNRHPLVVTATSMLLAASAIVTACVSPSMSTRIAVLQYGGSEKLVIRHVLWPMFDADGDGASGRFWGTDADDSTASIQPLVPDRPGGEPAAVSPPSRPPTRNVVWVLVDTFRRDTFDACVRSMPELHTILADFADYDHYTTCGGRTADALETLLGARGCVAPGLRGGIVKYATDAGYESVHLGSYVGFGPSFEVSALQRTDRAALEAAASSIRSLSTDAEKGHFVFVHLHGGHAPYPHHASTPEASYAGTIGDLMKPLADFLAVVPRDWVLVVMGDHGEELDEHGLYGHALSLYQEVLRTPFLVRAPALSPGSRHQALGCVEAKEVIASAMSDTDLDPHATSWNRLATLDVQRGRFGLLWDLHLRAIYQHELKVIWDPMSGTWELYDLEADPHELRNLAILEPNRLRQPTLAMQAAVSSCAIRGDDFPRDGHD